MSRKKHFLIDIQISLNHKLPGNNCFVKILDSYVIVTSKFTWKWLKILKANSINFLPICYSSCTETALLPKSSI